ncbi:MAG TPA: DUF1924 domain-containing protein, partial [Rhodocyclaceae bacterium]|nr:DUF1924 domain-containing protein [Rhodocyclaceae bacterium]
QAGYATEAKKDDPAFAGFSADRGKEFFQTKHGKEYSCSSCHTENPANPGKNAANDNVIKPMAPSANPDRFTDLGKTEKNFKRRCNDVLGRECTAKEKGDVIAYLLSVK